jgi:fumarate reductase subunit D|tara:strand:- start:3415 stop:3753 length:339 start_codon:yes stop_codon:yes gene_type:complete
MKTHRNHANYWAFVLHRISGLALLLFLPAHFYVLALAVEQSATLDMFLSWTEAPVVKLLETGLVILLAAHMTGGLRILAIEFLAWRNWQKSVVAITGGLSLAAGLLFLLNAG